MIFTDIAKTARSMEVQGYQFYINLAAAVEEEKTKTLAMRLAEEEKEHIKVFDKIISAYSGDEKFDQGTSDYMASIGMGGIFPEPDQIKKMAGEIQSLRDVLAIGIQAEKDAILLYHELLERTGSEQSRKMIYKILEEEKMHLVELRNLSEEKEI